MKIVVTGPATSYEELKGGNENVEWIKVSDPEKFADLKDADAFFNLEEDAASILYSLDKIVFINSVITTIHESSQKENVVRINGWSGFLKRDTWELAGKINKPLEIILQALKKKSIVVADEAGFISARILSMIINEAYFAKMDGVSSEEEIDIAMQLGTNYPKGPFEWASEIGKNKIFLLLEKLKETDNRYTPALLLQQESLFNL